MIFKLGSLGRGFKFTDNPGLACNFAKILRYYFLQSLQLTESIKSTENE